MTEVLVRPATEAELPAAAAAHARSWRAAHRLITAAGQAISWADGSRVRARGA